MKPFIVVFTILIVAFSIGLFSLWERDGHYIGTVKQQDTAVLISHGDSTTNYLLRVKFYEPRIETWETVPDSTYNAAVLGDDVCLTLDHEPGHKTSLAIILTAVSSFVLVIFTIVCFLVWFFD